MSKSLFLGTALVLTTANLAAAQTTKPVPPRANEPIPSVVKKKPIDSTAVVEKKTVNARLEVLETEFRFGYAPQNAKISHNYWLRNAGPDTLHLSDVRPGCGCTKAPLKTNVLGPGDSTDVEVIFSTGQYNNKAAKNASIIADVPHPIPPLSFTAYPRSNLDSLTPFVVMPPRLNLDSLKDQSQTGLLAVRVKNTSTEPISFKLVSTPDHWFTIDVPGGSIAPGSEESIQVRVTDEIANEVINKSFTIEASDKDLTRFTVPIQKAQRWGPTTTSAAQ